MPAQPAWFHRLDEILRELRALDVRYLDRQAVEKLLRVRQRRARQLMAGLPCLQVGNAVAVSGAALVEYGEAFELSQAMVADFCRAVEQPLEDSQPT